MQLPHILSNSYRSASHSDLATKLSDVVSSVSLGISCLGQSPEGKTLKAILELSYGFRDLEGRKTRAAASAGARYPTEFVLVRRNKGIIEQFLYDDEKREFCNVDLLCTQRIQQELEEQLNCKDVWAIVACSLAWRTVSRYRVRGLQYCVIDAYNALGNIVEIAYDMGLNAHLIPCEAVERICVSEQYGSAFLPMGVAIFNASHVDENCYGPVTVNPPGIGLTEPVPRFSPELARVKALYRAHFGMIEVPFEDADYWSRETRVPIQWAMRRKSLRRDSPGLDLRRLDSALSLLSTYLDNFSRMCRGQLVALIDKDRLGASGQSCLDMGKYDGITSRWGMSESCFPDQSWLNTAECCVVMIGLHKEKPEDSVTTMLEGSIVCSLMLSDLERSLQALDVECSMLGGFSIEETHQFWGVDNTMPILGLAFGPKGSNGVKSDADAV